MRNDTKLDILWDEVEQLKKSGGGGSDLPEVTEADNGKLLGVVNGAWGKTDAPIGGVDYSTTEKATGLKWIDGKEIYQKTFVDTTEFSGTSAHAYYLANSIISDLDEVVDIKTKAIIGGGDAYGNPMIPTPGVTSTNISNYIRIGYDPAQGIYEYGRLESSLSLTKLICTLYYTKATATKSKKKTTK